MLTTITRQSKEHETMDTIKQAYDKAFLATVGLGIGESQRHMVACLAVKAAMDDTLENLVALHSVATTPPC